MAERSVVVATYSGGEGDKLLPLKNEQEPPADHVFQLAIVLLPFPCLAKSTRDGRAAFDMVVGDYLLNKGNVVFGNGAIAIRQDGSHAVLCNPAIR